MHWTHNIQFDKKRKIIFLEFDKRVLVFQPCSRLYRQIIGLYTIRGVQLQLNYDQLLCSCQRVSETGSTENAHVYIHVESSF